MTKIFVSYSRRDLDVANRLTDALEHAGHQAWIDRQDIRSGADWQEEIVRAIQDAEYFVLLLSPDSVTSADVLKELTLADRERKRFFPALLRGVDVPKSMQYALVNLQTVDLFQNFDTGVARLLDALQAAEPASAGSDAAEEASINIRDQTTGTSSERAVGMRLGALCWGAGCCLGALLAAGISRGPTGALSLAASTTFIGTAFGVVFGSIFKKKVMDMVAIVVAPVFGMMALMLILPVFFYAGLGLPFEDPVGLITWIAGSILGAGLWIVTKLWTRRTFVEQLKKTGTSLPTQ